ncbi:SWIM-type [Hexamita inflata]|uniref:SWIM-type n=1 Tax=Hexamita inflata TaxID=28002 RepID=A0AA86QM08_9EUKA|nr:SWIM-type [Hexamita inflata]
MLSHTIFRGKFSIFLNKTFLVEFENDEPIESQECSCMVMKVQLCPCSHILYFTQHKGQISNFDLVRTFVNHDLFSISKYVDYMDLLYGNQRRIHGEVIKQRIKRDREGVMDEINFEEEPASYEEMKRLLLTRQVTVVLTIQHEVLFSVIADLSFICIYTDDYYSRLLNVEYIIFETLRYFCV